MTTTDLIGAYYDSIDRKDDRWQQLWADDGTFGDASGALNAGGRDAVIQSFTPFLKGVKRAAVKQLIAEGDDACAIVAYEYVNPKGQSMAQDVAEVWKVQGDALAALTIYFDLTAYRSFMRG